MKIMLIARIVPIIAKIEITDEILYNRVSKRIECKLMMQDIKRGENYE
jgi:hypothetical protein